MVDGRLPDIALYGALFAGAVAAFCLERLTGGGFGLTSDIVAVAGNATCGWSWLLVRALFQRPAARRETWPLMLVLALVATGAFLRFDGSASGAMPRMIDNVETLVSSTLLLLATIEPLKAIGSDMTRAERRFRILFAAGYATVLAIAVLWVDGSPADSIAGRWGGWIKMGCAVLALLGIGLAILYRGRNPLPDARKAKPRTQSGEEAALGERLLRLMRDEALYALPDLRVAEVARRIGEAEYKVTQCITGALGFRNFNHMANHFRIGEAQRRLADARLDPLPILTIALDCGFGSIGPFNRAFKAETGMTPTQFRKARATP
ncbi:helix-turn-helix domain-containing protein [Novosphingobium album (ex Liu et al. 2023)]|nr:AraC family transcriptional regulator [Novosphingobium album (ex Liu et al. 2023)]